MGNFLINYNNTKIIVIFFFILILTNLVNAQYIFDLDVKVIPKTITPNENIIIVNSNIISLGLNFNERIDVKLSYEIVDKNNKIIDAKSSTVALQTSLSVSEILDLPNNLKSGKYYINVKVDYKGYNVYKSEEFYIEEKSLIGKLNYLIDKSPIILLIAFLVLILLVIWGMINHIYLYNRK